MITSLQLLEATFRRAGHHNSTDYFDDTFQGLCGLLAIIGKRRILSIQPDEAIGL
jgi:hypothetical protein